MKSIFTWSLPLCRIAGIPVLIHWSWFVVAYFQIVSPKPYHYAWFGWFVLEYVALFTLVLLHELGHAFACRSVGGKVGRIILWPLGGLALVKPPPRPGPLLWTIAAGPLVNLALTPALYGLWLAASQGSLRPPLPDHVQFLLIVLIMNVVLLLFNLLPVYPLDGGQILHALLWFVLGQGRSLAIASFLGIVTGVVGIAFGGVWLILGVFVALGAAAGLLRADHLSRPGGAALLNSLIHLQNGHDAAVRDGCTQAIAQLVNDPAGLATARAHRGIAALALGDLDQALADQEEAVRLVSSPGSLLARGLTRLACGQTGAEGDFSEAIRLRPGLAAAYGYRALVRLANQDYEGAIADCDVALRLEPKNLLAYLARSCGWAQQANFDRAEEDFSMAQRLDSERAGRMVADRRVCLGVPDYVAELRTLANCLYAELAGAAARQHVEDSARPMQFEDKIIKKLYGWGLAVVNGLIWLRPRSARLRIERGEIYREMGEWDKALEDFLEAIRLDPASFAAHNNLAWMLAACKSAAVRDGRRALEHARQACELTGWKSGATLDTLAAAYAELGDFAAAIRWQNEALADAAFRKTSDQGGRARLQLYEAGKPASAEPQPDSQNPFESAK